MCGICGFNNAEKSDFKTLENMCNKMLHRGPDGSGYYIHDKIALGHRRLSLVDLENGGQPIIRKSDAKSAKAWHSTKENFENSGDFAIVMNGEIYNYKDIRAELEKEGYKFSTHSDTEVVLTGYIK